MGARWLMLMGLACWWCAASRAAAEQDDEIRQLAGKIDEHIERRLVDERVRPAPVADDAEFLRRVHLDIGGKIPTVAEVRGFLADTSPNKRREAVDRLLESPAYITNFTAKWRSVLMPEANSDVQVRFLVPSFEVWLRQKLIDNTPYDAIVRELLTLPLDDRNMRNSGLVAVAAGRPTPIAFYQAKQIAPENLAAAASRMFLGIRIECAQCHDHPFDRWKRDSFWSFAAFFAGIERTDPERGIAGGVVELLDRREIGVPGTDRVVQASYPDGSEPQWRFRAGPRQTLADWITSPDNPYFARAAANRMWGHFFGIGIVDPVDDFSNNNPPSHRELLDELAAAFAAHDFDLKFLIRAITASRVYQRTSAKTQDSQTDPRLFARMAVKGLTASQLYDCVLQATGGYEPYSPQRTFQIIGTDPRREFEELFANDSDTPTEKQSTILQALTLMNGRTIAQATDLRSSKLLAAVLDYPLLDDPQRLETLFLATLSRPPREEEFRRLAGYLDSGGPHHDRRQAFGDVFWALLNSSEFMLNH